MKRHATYGLFLILLALTACASLGITTPQTFGESMVYGYTMNAQIRRSAADALRSGAISKEDAQRVLQVTDTARTALDEARKAGCPQFTREPKEGDKPACLESIPQTAMERMKFAVGLVNQALQFLQARGFLKESRALFS